MRVPACLGPVFVVSGVEYRSRGGLRDELCARLPCLHRVESVHRYSPVQVGSNDVGDRMGGKCSRSQRGVTPPVDCGRQRLSTGRIDVPVESAESGTAHGIESIRVLGYRVRWPSTSNKR